MISRALQAYARAEPRRSQLEERCELCGQRVPEQHRHVADLEKRRVRCACQACSLLFEKEGAARGHYRTIPDRVLVDPNLVLTPDLWRELGIPVQLAFVLFDSRLGRWVALYPGPAGLAEAEIADGPWQELSNASPLVGAVERDVEALLCWAPRGAQQFEVYLAPIDTCYELAARVRRSWRGVDGGDEVRHEVAEVFVRLRVRSRRVRSGAGDDR